MLGNCLNTTCSQQHTFRNINVVKRTFRLSQQASESGTLNVNMIPGARHFGPSISETLGWTENGPWKRTYPMSGSCVDDALWIWEDRWGQADWVQLSQQQLEQTIKKFEKGSSQQQNNHTRFPSWWLRCRKWSCGFRRLGTSGQGIERTSSDTYLLHDVRVAYHVIPFCVKLVSGK